MILPFLASKLNRCTGSGLTGAGACIIISLAITALPLDARMQPEGVILPGVSASIPGHPSASLINPVLGGVNDSFSVQYRYWKYDGLDRGANLGALTWEGFAFSYARLHGLYDDSVLLEEEGDYYYASKGIMLNNFIGFGAGYYHLSPIDSPYDNINSWNFSFLLQPAEYISFSMVYGNINTPTWGDQKVPRRYWYSLALRPFGDRISLACDVKKYKGESISDVPYAFSVHTRLFKDIMVNLQADTDNNYNFGISMPLDFSGENARTLIADYQFMSHNIQGQEGYMNGGVVITNERYDNSLCVRGRYLRISLAHDFREVEEVKLFKKPKTTFSDLVRVVRLAGNDVTIEGIIINIEKPVLSFSKVQELRKELKTFRKNKKKVYVIMNSVGNREYYLATAADKIFLTPGQSFFISGLGAEVYFFKSLLDKVGVKFEEVKHGTYKSFGEGFTRDSMSKAFRENVISLLKSSNRQFVGDIAEDRKMDENRVNAQLERGIITEKEACSLGFVDECAYPDEAIERIIKHSRIVRDVVDLDSYTKENVHTYQWGAEPVIAVVHVSGNIVRGSTERDGLFSPSLIGDRDYYLALKKAFTNPFVKAVVIRVNSGGGSAFASELMWHYLVEFKKKHSKPVVFSFGNIAASGGYYVACTGDPIFVNGNTLTGSIGVIMGKVSLKELYGKLGIHKDVVKMNKFADLFSESRTLTGEEEKMLQDSVDHMYNRFTTRVKNARNITSDRISSVAEGRVFTGSQALENGLADREGGLLTAISYAAAKAGVDRRFSLMQLPLRKENLSEIMDKPDLQSILRDEMKLLIDHAAVIRLKDEQVLYLNPYKIIIK